MLIGARVSLVLVFVLTIVLIVMLPFTIAHVGVAFFFLFFLRLFFIAACSLVSLIHAAASDAPSILLLFLRM